jgi:small GTP-binding protein
MAARQDTSTTDEGTSASFKVIIVGDTGVGKSSLVFRMVDNVFYEDHCQTLGVDFKYARLHVAGVDVNLQLWDTAGQDQFANMTAQYYRGCHGAVLCYDITNHESFKRVDLWCQRLANQLGKLPPIVLVGCKLDLADPEICAAEAEGGAVNPASSPSRLALRQVGRQEAEAWAAKNGALFLETSSKLGTHVHDAFNGVVKSLLDHHGIVGRERSTRRSRPVPLKKDDPSTSAKADAKGEARRRRFGCC